MRRGLLVCVLALLLVGCGEVKPDPTAARSDLEQIIRSQLPDKVRQRGGPAVYVESVQCTNASENRYDCVATVTGSDGRGNPATEDIGISGTCDRDGCVWRTDPSY